MNPAHEVLNGILQQLLNGDISCLNPNNIVYVSNLATRYLDKNPLDEYDKMCVDLIIAISQIVYDNTDRSMLFLDDGVYDLLLEKNKTYNENFQVGGRPIQYSQDGEITFDTGALDEPVIFLENPKEFEEKALFSNEIRKKPPIDTRLFQTIDRNSGKVIKKRNVNIPHMYPKLVGSLDKCKFVLNQEAAEHGVFDDYNVKIFERDFLAKHLQMGLIDMVNPFTMIAELKYDGVSVEADVTNKILSARSRGDANADIAADMSEILAGYEFPYAPKMPESEKFGMKFEAIITHANLEKLSKLKGKIYANSRNGIIGLLGSSDAYDFRDLITLVPLETSLDVDRVTEIEFLNKYYHSGVLLNYAIITGTYIQVLYQVNEFLKEAEMLRPIMPFMYDGIVVSYADPRIREVLGRENSINKYSMAVKFSPLAKQAIFTHYSYTVGQNGVITPMIHYTPVEFYGTIHNKSSGHSYGRFKELNLAAGDVIQIDYNNDVMPYVTKPFKKSNLANNNPPEEFPLECPFCGMPIEISDSGKSAYCINIVCPGRNIARIANMVDKLGIKDCGEETIRALGTSSFSEFMTYTKEDLRILGPLKSENLLNQIIELGKKPIKDYKIMGSIGFTDAAIETWKKILVKIPLEDIAYKDQIDLYNELVKIRHIGANLATTIVRERDQLFYDIAFIVNMPNVIRSFGDDNSHPRRIIRYTGCRPTDKLTEYLESRGCDANPSAGVTKATNILVVPYQGFVSSKTYKVSEQCLIIDMTTFAANPDEYIRN